jgi:hypothetical protein
MQAATTTRHLVLVVVVVVQWSRDLDVIFIMFVALYTYDELLY